MRQITWTGRPVNENSDHFDKIRGLIPTFCREGFKVNGKENEHLDTIIKMPQNSGESQIPVATVSKRYSLVQHHEVFDAIEKALRTMKYPTENIETHLQLTTYGERMWLKMKFQEAHSFDPGDGHDLTLQLHALNSVDGSTSLTFEMGWFRLICENGLMHLDRGAVVRTRHTPSLENKQLGEYLENSIKAIFDESEIYREWYKTPIDKDWQLLKDWIDSAVAKKWGPGVRRVAITSLQPEQTVK